MNGNIFTRSFSWVIGAFLLVLAFFRGPEQPWLFAAIFVVWGAYLAFRFLLPKAKLLAARIKQSMQKRKGQHSKQKNQPAPMGKQQPATFVEGDELGHLLLGHVNCRISEKLKSAYPEATWQWCESHPEANIRGGTGRIRTFNTEDYTHAEVTVGEYFKINFKMMKIVDFAAAANPEGAEENDADAVSESEPKVVDPSVWYELVGREVLTALITDWSTRGHAELHIAEDGVIYFNEGADEIKAEELKELPAKQYWPELAKCLEKDDLKVQLLDNRIAVAWG